PVVAIAVAAFEALAEVPPVVALADIAASVAVAAVQPAVVVAVVELPAVHAIGLSGIPAFTVAIAHRLAQDLGTVAVGAVPASAIAVAVVVRGGEERVAVVVEALLVPACLCGQPAPPVVLLVAVLRVAAL